MTWTSIPKPTDATWTNTNTQGREQYDQASLTFDDSSVFYDGYNPMDWTDVAKPTGGAYLVAGMATGLICPPTYSRSYDASPWIKISKPIT